VLPPGGLRRQRVLHTANDPIGEYRMRDGGSRRRGHAYAQLGIRKHLRDPCQKREMGVVVAHHRNENRVEVRYSLAVGGTEGDRNPGADEQRQRLLDMVNPRVRNRDAVTERRRSSLFPPPQCAQKRSRRKVVRFRAQRSDCRKRVASAPDIDIERNVPGAHPAPDRIRTRGPDSLRDRHRWNARRRAAREKAHRHCFA